MRRQTRLTPAEGGRFAGPVGSPVPPNAADMGLATQEQADVANATWRRLDQILEEHGCEMVMRGNTFQWLVIKGDRVLMRIGRAQVGLARLEETRAIVEEVVRREAASAEDTLEMLDEARASENHTSVLLDATRRERDELNEVVKALREKMGELAIWKSHRLDCDQRAHDYDLDAGQCRHCHVQLSDEDWTVMREATGRAAPSELARRIAATESRGEQMCWCANENPLYQTDRQRETFYYTCTECGGTYKPRMEKLRQLGGGAERFHQRVMAGTIIFEQRKRRPTIAQYFDGGGFITKQAEKRKEVGRLEDIAGGPSPKALEFARQVGAYDSLESRHGCLSCDPCKECSCAPDHWVVPLMEWPPRPTLEEITADAHLYGSPPPDVLPTGGMSLNEVAQRFFENHDKGLDLCGRPTGRSLMEQYEQTKRESKEVLQRAFDHAYPKKEG